MFRCEGLIQRKHVLQDNTPKCFKDSQSVDEVWKSGNRTNDDDSIQTELTLMEELFLLGLKDKDGHTSFWNDFLSTGLRGCILIELGLRGRIELEPTGLRRKNLSSRKLIVKNSSPTGDVLLDETLKYIKEANPPESVQNWLKHLSGETWNPVKLGYHLKNVRERLAKNLVEKGVLTTDKKSFFLFEMTTHPLVDSNTKSKLVRKVQEALLTKWINDPQRMDKRILALIFMAQVSDVLVNVVNPLDDKNYDLVMKRIEALLELNMEEQCAKSSCSNVLWGVLAVFAKDTTFP